MATKDELDLAQLADTYDLLGQVGGTDGAQVTLATRKADRLPVLLTAYRELEGDEGNALSHLASDAQLLAGGGHPAIVPVLEARWVGDALVLVTERIAAPSLEERLSRREEEFPFPRVGTVLRELNSALDWARERGVVHRSLRPDSVFLEDGSDRVRVTFVAQPLPGNGVPDERDDARSIATIARAMLTRSVADPERDAMPLAELRPGLPSRVVQQTEALMGRADSLEPVDVRAYVAGIAMAEELRRGEDECVRVTREMKEEQQAMREQLAAERKAHEEDIAEQARKFEAEKAEILKTMAREREETAKAMARERDAAEKQLRQERERFEKEMRQERERFQRETQKQSAALEKQRARITRERERLDREKERFERERTAAIAAASSAGVGAPALAAMRPDLEPQDEVIDEPEDELVEELVEAPYAEEAFVEDSLAEESGARDSFVEEAVEEEAAVAAPARASSFSSRPFRPVMTGSRLRSNARMLGIGAVVLLLVIAAAALAISRGGDDRPLASAATPGAEARVVDSLSGLTVPASPLDSAFAGIDSTAATPAARVAQRPVVRRPRRDTAVARPDTFVTTTPDTSAGVPLPGVQPAPLPPLPFTRADSVTRTDTTTRRDSTVRRDSIVPRRDTMPAGGAGTSGGLR